MTGITSYFSYQTLFHFELFLFVEKKKKRGEIKNRDVNNLKV